MHDDRTDDLRDRIVGAAVTSFRRLPFHEVDLAVVTEAAGLPPAAVAACFPTWEDLLGTTITIWNSERLRPIAPIAERGGAVAFLRSVVVANQADPALMRLLVVAATIASSPTHPVAATLQHQYLQFHAMVQRALANDVAVGREPEGTDPAEGAEQLVALYEGLQLQSMLRPTMHLVDSFDRAASRLQSSWREPAAAAAAGTAVWRL